MGSNQTKQTAYQPRETEEKNATIVAHFGGKTFEVKVKEKYQVGDVVKTMYKQHDDFFATVLSSLCCRCRDKDVVFIPCTSSSSGRLYFAHGGNVTFGLRDQEGKIVQTLRDLQTYELFLFCQERTDRKPDSIDDWLK